jgi:hypothetical protein
MTGQSAKDRNREEDQVAWLIAATTPLPFVSTAQQCPAEQKEDDAWDFVPRERSCSVKPTDKQGENSKNDSPHTPTVANDKIQARQEVSPPPACRSPSPRSLKLTALEKRQRATDPSRDPSGVVAIAYQWADHNAAKQQHARAKAVRHQARAATRAAVAPPAALVVVPELPQIRSTKADELSGAETPPGTVSLPQRRAAQTAAFTRQPESPSDGPEGVDTCLFMDEALMRTDLDDFIRQDKESKHMKITKRERDDICRVVNNSLHGVVDTLRRKIENVEGSFEKQGVGIHDLGKLDEKIAEISQGLVGFEQDLVSCNKALLETNKDLQASNDKLARALKELLAWASNDKLAQAVGGTSPTPAHQPATHRPAEAGGETAAASAAVPHQE